MRSDLVRLAAELSQRDEPFVVATVVRREAPSSARVGDSAIITQAGTFHGWLGGSCTRPTVLELARQALVDGLPRLVAISPEPELNVRPGVINVPMTCHSGGSVDVYVEPMLPAPRLVVYGISPAAQSLVRIGKVLGYSVEAVDPDADVTTFPEADFVITDSASDDFSRRAKRDPARLVVVVATQGEWDEEALEHALKLSPSYVGLIASRKRFGEIKAVLQSKGVTAEAMDTIACPAGLNIGAIAPEEIALSVMTEIVQRFRAAAPVGAEEPKLEKQSIEHAIDPVCGMTVDPHTAKHHADVSGQRFVFCCGGCRERFLSDPETYLARTEHTHEA